MSITDSRLKEGVLTFGPAASPDLTVSCQATEVTLEPDFDETSDPVETLCGDELPAVVKTTWSLNFTGIQDWENADGFVNYAFDHDGEVIEFVWKPRKNGPTWSGSCQVKAVLIGGEINQRITSDAEWPVVGTPTRTPTTLAETAAAPAPKAKG
ncbi:hypothetical protein [Catenulispora rubra]|uniref:hypothetical protein n=1 Tax=Catenulispora rubra TaxID=280293 RepID=UPI0018920BB7|nr:hypothetical protein [Catenulispora rubra]